MSQQPQTGLPGFRPPAAERTVPRDTTRPAQAAEEPSRPPSQSPPPSPPPESLEQEAAEVVDRGLRGRLRALAGGRRPLGSRYQRVPPLLRTKTTTSSSLESSDLTAAVNAGAVGIRNLSRLLHWVLGPRSNRDWVATAEECYAISAPIVKLSAENVEEVPLIGAAIERAGLIGVLAAIGGYLFRIVMDQPGGSLEEEMIRETVATRLAKAHSEQRVKSTAAESKPAPDPTAFGTGEMWVS